MTKKLDDATLDRCCDFLRREADAMLELRAELHRKERNLVAAIAFRLGEMCGTVVTWMVQGYFMALGAYLFIRWWLI